MVAIGPLLYGRGADYERVFDRHRERERTGRELVESPAVRWTRSCMSSDTLGDFERQLTPVSGSILDLHRNGQWIAPWRGVGVNGLRDG